MIARLSRSITRSRFARSLVCATVVSVGVIAPQAARADSITVLAPTLPSARHYTSAVWDGTNAYVFGGYDGTNRLAQIVAFTPSTNTGTTLSAALPSARSGTSAVWDGTNAYIFGGYDGTNRLAQIVEFTPSTNTVTTLSATLPSARSGTSAVWDGTNAYIFGGYDGTTYLNQVVKFTPASGSVSIASSLFPPTSDSSAAYIGGRAFVFGGKSSTGTTGQIVRFTPSSSAIATMNATLAGAFAYTTTTTDGSSAFIFGGDDGTARSHAIERYDPSVDAVTIMSATLPSLTCCASAVWTGSAGLIFGGKSVSYGASILRYDTTPGSPQSVVATGGSTSINLSWQAPASNTFGSPITGYKVYRGTSAGTESFLTQLGNVLTYTDSGLGSSATRYYKISAINAAGEGTLSVEVSATTGGGPPPPPPPPPPSGSPAAPFITNGQGGPGAGQITLTWSVPASNGSAITAYNVYRGASSGSETLAFRLGNTTMFTDSALPNGTQRFYEVSAINASGEGPLSNEVFARTFSVPSAPQSLKVSPGLLPNREVLSWQAPASNGGTEITGYAIYRGASSGAERFLAVTGPATTYTDRSCSIGMICYYRVSALNVAGESPRSSEVFMLGLSLP